MYNLQKHTSNPYLHLKMIGFGKNKCCLLLFLLFDTTTGVTFGKARERRPFGSDTEGGETCLASSVFWLVIPTWQQEI